MSFLSSLMNALPGAAAQGLAWGIMAIGVYITFRILDVADLTVDGSLATGGAVVVSQYVGRGDTKKATEAARQVFLVILALSLLLMALVLLFNKQVLPLIYPNLEPDVVENALIYFEISALSFPVLALYNSGAAIFRSMGNSKISMYTSLIMNVINIGLNAALIFGLKMGVAGAAWASFIARAVAAAVVIGALRNKKNVVCVRSYTLKPKWSMISNILRIGVPTGLENGMFQVGKILIAAQVAGYGTIAIAANAVGFSVSGVQIIPGIGIGLGMITVVGQCVGAGDYAQARRYNRKLMLISWLLIAASVAAILTSLPLLLNLYNISDEARVLSAQLVRLHNIPAVALWCLSFTLPNTLRAAGDARFTMVVSIASMAVFRIGFSVVLGIWMGMGAIGVWIAMDIDWVCRVICFVARYFSGAWTRKYQNYQA